MPTLLPSLLAWGQRFYWTAQLKKAIPKGDVARAKLALSKGAEVNGWKAKGPYLFMAANSPGFRMDAKDSLNLAFLWKCEPEMFRLLVCSGACVEDFQHTSPEMTDRAEFLDQLDRNVSWQRWLADHGSDIAQICGAFSLANTLSLTTPPAQVQGSLSRRL